MTVSLSTVHITVDDPEAALAFYRDTLGLTVSLDVSNDGFRWITLVSDAQPEIGIVLSQPHGGRSQEDGDALATLLAKGELYPVHFACADLDSTFDKIVGTPGVEVLAGEMDRVQLSLGQERGQRVPVVLGSTPVRLGQHDPDLGLGVGDECDPAEAIVRHVEAHGEAEGVAIEGKRGLGIVDGDVHGAE